MTTNLITISFPNDDTVAAHLFGEALLRLSATKEGRDYPTIINHRDDSDRINANNVEHRHGKDEQIPAVTASPEVLEQISKAAENGESIELSVGAVNESKEFFDPKDYPYMIAPNDVDVRLVSNQREYDELLSAGYRVVTKDELADFERAEPGHEGDLDKEGLRWDERIHSGSKARVKDGTWRLRKKPADLSDEEWQQQIETVKAELKMPDVTTEGDDHHIDTGVVTEQNVAAITPIAPPAPAVVVPPVTVAPPAPAVVVPPVTVAPPVTAETAYTGPTTFPDLMAFIMEHMEEVTPFMAELCAEAGIEHVRVLNEKPEKIEEFYKLITTKCQL